MKAHPRIGFNILSMLDFPTRVKQVVFQHHERMDGSGYPLSIKGKQIQKESKVLIFADVVDAMLSPRPY
jgi:HD-GYP domain-containing protein (c-di-GMP phosphodiesterase class II)